jgi:predicted Zn-ribbon and HTH transcriptional regulator
MVSETGPTQRRRKLWPVAECLHKHTIPEARIVNMVGQVQRIVPERCYDCGYRFPVDASDLT